PIGGLFRRIPGFDHDGFDLAGAAAAEGGGAVVLVGGEAGDALLEGGKLDHYEAVKFVRAFHDLVAPAARQHLAAELGNDAGYQVRVLLVFDRVVDLGTGNPVGRHRVSPDSGRAFAYAP